MKNLRGRKAMLTLAVLGAAILSLSSGSAAGEDYCLEMGSGMCLTYLSTCDQCNDIHELETGGGGSCPIDVACFECNWQLVWGEWICDGGNFCGVSFCAVEEQ
jgi:hypothetical protein